MRENLDMLRDWDTLTETEKKELIQRVQSEAFTNFVILLAVNVVAALFLPRLSRWLLLRLEQKLLKHAS